ncbi:MAG: hypothetical protein EOO51_12540 [Flavobacterium sp.]|nr:MAG: hypothetical protein EOO51_12540 [Flavobacterium sp.]
MKKLTLLIATSLILCSCLGTKSASEKSSSIVEKESNVKTTDSAVDARINKAIADAFKLMVPASKTSDEAFNKAVNSAVDEILEKLNVNKQSGDNSYSLMYDRIKRELIFQAKIAETSNKNSVVKTTEKHEKSFSQNVDEYLSKKANSIPWWFWLIAAVWFLPQIVSRMRIIANPIGFLRK